ncbi:hypothetical protein [Halalkalibacter flavus]|uniref:hypothetical protein n=1 Tax=Halalkalibacter flavus TaxID=3090668 RepID=UPI002FCA3418
MTKVNNEMINNEEVVLTPIPANRGLSNYLSDTENGRIWNKKLGRFLQVNPNDNGYVYASLIDDNGVTVRVGVHRLIMASVSGIPLEFFKRGKIEVDHYPNEEERWNNSRHNLKMATRHSQYRDSTKAKMGKGKRLKESEVCEILEQLAEWKEDENNKLSTFIHMVADSYDQTYRNAHNIVYGKSWTHLHSGANA